MGRLTSSLILVYLIQNLATAQIRKPNFFEVIQDDSVMVFFTRSYWLTEKQCADYTRFIRGNDNGDFRGDFVDVDLDNDLLGTGRYHDGKKHGYFEIFYPTGKLKCKGNYSNDIPVGQWNFYYESGLPERTIEFVGDEIALLQFVDKKGRISVVNGKGRFKGIVMGREGNRVNLMAKGKVVNGRPNGKWKSWYPDRGWRFRFSNEIYKDGKFIKGKFLRSYKYVQINSIPFGGRRDTLTPRAIRRTKDALKTYNQCLNNFFLDNYLSELEKFHFRFCDSSRIQDQKSNLSRMAFRTEMSSRLAEALKNDPKYLAREYEQGSSYYLTLRFSANAEGQPENFEGASFLGNQFDSSVASAISGLTLLGTERDIYFRLKITFVTPTQYRFSYRFTNDKLKSW